MSTHVQCPCGAIKIEISAEPAAQFYCHCRDCQTAHSAAYISVSMYPAESVIITDGEPKTWMVEKNPRFTCPECGTRLFAEPPGLGVRGLVAGLLPEGQFSSQFHIFCDEAVLPVDDGLSHFKGVPAAFGGSDETVDW